MKGKKAVQSKFPTARIKKIMQADEDVGKVAQGTPIVISRALELFLKDMVAETTEIARSSGSKKLMPYHVKRLVSQNRQYDFLDDLVSSVPDPTAGLSSAGGGGALQPAAATNKKLAESKVSATSRKPPPEDSNTKLEAGNTVDEEDDYDS